MASAKSSKKRPLDQDRGPEAFQTPKQRRVQAKSPQQRNFVSGSSSKKSPATGRNTGYRPQRPKGERNTETQTEWASACIDEGFAGKTPGGEKGSLYPAEDKEAGKLQARGYFIQDHNIVTVQELKKLVKEEVGGIKGPGASHKVLLVPQTTIYPGQLNNEKLRWVQTGMGPNYQGGVTTLTACRHEKRCSKSVMGPAREMQGDGTKLWLAVVVAKGTLRDGLRADYKVPGKLAIEGTKLFSLVSLHRIKQGYDSQEELWNSLSDSAKKAKNVVENRIGDVFVPSRSPPKGSTAKEVRFYEEPNYRYRHWFEELYDKRMLERERTQEDVSARDGLLLRSYSAAEGRLGTSFIFGAVNTSPGFWDENYEDGMVPHGGVIPLPQFLGSLQKKGPDLEALTTAAEEKSKSKAGAMKTSAGTGSSDAQKKEKTQKVAPTRRLYPEKRLRALRKVHKYV